MNSSTKIFVNPEGVQPWLIVLYKVEVMESHNECWLVFKQVAFLVLDIPWFGNVASNCHSLEASLHFITILYLLNYTFWENNILTNLGTAESKQVILHNLF